MRKIAVVGAGLGGVVLANGLLDCGFEVTLVTDKSGEEIRNGTVLSTQSLWGPALAIKRQFGLNLWDKDNRGIGGFRIRFGDTAANNYHEFAAALSAPGQSIDFRVALPALLSRFAARRGTLSIRAVDIDDLSALADDCDLVIVATGRARGRMRDLFSRDETRSTADRPKRVGGVIYLAGRREAAPQCRGGPPFEEWTLIPGVGEFFVIPAFSLGGNCHIICLEGYIGGPLDCWQDVNTVPECMQTMVRLIDEWLPWERDRCRDVRLIDDRAAIWGGFTPVVRRPVGQLPCGRPVLAFGDLFVLNDPLVAQGGNTAIYLAKMLIEDIVAHGLRPFDRDWMAGHAAKAWDYARWTVQISDMFLTPNDNLWRWFDHATKNPAAAKAIVRGYEDPQAWVRLLSAPAPTWGPQTD
jgi:2-polyprenyl-6-methoxyphenol hydroxylase-like FAD-dependent oxidoreductase